MNLSPGGQASISFSVNQGGTLTGTGTASATVLRNGIITSVVTTVTEPSTGQYVVSFAVPATWIEYDMVDVHFEYAWAGGTIGCPKRVGVVTEVPLDVEFMRELLTADQVRVGNSIFYYAAGTGQTVLLHQQDQIGDPCTGDTSLIQP